MSIDSLRKFKQQGTQNSQNVSQFKSSSNLAAFKSTLRSTPKKPSVIGGLWNTLTRNIIKPVSAASNFLEDTGKTIAFPIAKLGGYKGTWQDAKKSQGIDFIGHQKDVWTGKNNRTYSDITREIGNEQKSPVLRNMIKTVGYGGDVILDPLNKVKIAALTAKGIKASKTGKVALSVADQAKQGQRAFLQFGKRSILPGTGNKILKASTALNDWLRGTKIGRAGVKALSSVSTKVRPLDVARDEFKMFKDAKTKASNIIGYKTDKAIKLATEFEKTLLKRKATDIERSQLLHAIEKGKEELAPVSFQDIWKKGVDFKAENEALWKTFGGSTIEGHGLSHFATKEVAEASRKEALKGGKLFSPNTPQDIHRQWMKVNGEVVNLRDAGIKYIPDAFERGKGGFFDKLGNPVKIEQASAKEINEALTTQGKNSIFQEDLPTVIAKMGISTGRKEAGTGFLNSLKGIKSEAGQTLANETYEQMSGVEAVNKAIKGYDKVLGLWKAQALVAPAYHVRNAVGNVWNNYLAGTAPTDYLTAGKIQRGMKTGKLDAKSAQLVEEMEKNGVLGGGWYAKDITQAIQDEVKGGNFNPLSQRFKLFRGNKAVGETIENNARIAHYLSKRRAGFSVEEAAKSVQKYLFDYGDLTWGEKNILKRALPFYTWTSKNIPLQLSEMVKQPGKFAKVAIAKKDREQGVEQPIEQYLSDYIKNNSPIRIRKDRKDGSTQYLLLGQWLPAAQAINFLSQPTDSLLAMVTPFVKTPIETWMNKSSYFKNTLGEASDISSRPGQKKNFLGLDIDPRTKNVLSSIRILNELDKLNPGDIFGSQGKGSFWNKIGIPNASKNRGTRNSPDSSQTSRIINMFVGKATNYDPKQSKFFYDLDTAKRTTEMKGAIKEALKNKQPAEAKKASQALSEFLKQRNSK